MSCLVCIYACHFYSCLHFIESNIQIFFFIYCNILLNTAAHTPFSAYMIQTATYLHSHIFVVMRQLNTGNGDCFYDNIKQHLNFTEYSRKWFLTLFVALFYANFWAALLGNCDERCMNNISWKNNKVNKLCTMWVKPILVNLWSLLLVCKYSSQASLTLEKKFYISQKHVI